MKGRKPKPTALKLLEGNAGHRPLNLSEPKPSTGVPDCPAYLSPAAQEEWTRISAELQSMDLLCKLDRTTLASYCEDFALWIECMGYVKARGLMIKTTRGNPIQNPYLSIANGAKERMLKVLELFGGSPSARARIHTEPPTGADADEKDMFGDAR